MYTALYRAYRPEVFDQVLGQDHIIRILKNQIASGTTSHAYLFCGTRGTGKTTTARLLAKGLNCLSEGERPCGQCEACEAIRRGSFLDVVEIDAASNRGVDEIRALRDSVNYPPALGRNKVYIIDEVHMLTTEAFNALLKTLEEPPDYVTFILATTEPRKLPATILSRCLRLDFKRIPEAVLMEGMKEICRQIGIQVTDPALRIIAANADGSVRDGLSILDQCISGGDKVVDSPQVLEFLGASGESVFVDLTDLVSKRRTGEALQYLDGVLADGKDVRQLIRDWIGHYRNLLMTKFIRDPRDMINLSVENIQRVRDQSSVMDLEDINRGIIELSKTADAARWSTQPRILLEVCMVNLCQTGGLPARQAPVSRPQPQTGPAPGSAGPVGRMGAAPGPVSGPAGDPGPGPASGPLPSAAPAGETGGRDEATGRDVAGGEAARRGEATGRVVAGGEAAGRDEAAGETAGRDEAAGTLDALDAMIAAAQGKPTAGSEGGSAPSGPSQDPDLTTLWDEVFSDGEHRKGSIYLIRSNGMLTALDENTFTVTVKNDMYRRQTERNRKLLEDLMQARTGQARSMRVVVDDDGSDREISVEEAAARASEVLGAEVGIEG